MPPAGTSKLSDLQRSLLANLLAWERWARTLPDGLGRLLALRDGAPVTWLRGRPQRGIHTHSRANSAVFSRALLRLEQRGLLVRTNVRSGMPDSGKVRRSSGLPHGRTDHVFLTDEGHRVAEALAETANTNQFG